MEPYSLRGYVAGAYSSDNVMGVLNNIGEGIAVATELLCLGFAVHCPWTDHQYVLYDRKRRLTVPMLQANSMAHLKASHFLFLVPGWESSQGTHDEIKECNRLGIPVFNEVKDLLAWAEGQDDAM